MASHANANVYQMQFNRRLVPKRNSILDDYNIPGQTLGVGVNGKVKLLTCKKSGKRYALKVGRWGLACARTPPLARMLALGLVSTHVCLLRKPLGRFG